MECCLGKELTFAEISDLIIKGLNRLNNERNGFEKLNMEEIEKSVGRTDENGHWIHGGEKQVVVSIIYKKIWSVKNLQQRLGCPVSLTNQKYYYESCHIMVVHFGKDIPFCVGASF